MSKNYRPDGFQDVIPYVIAKGASKLIDFLKEAFDAELLFRMDQPDGTVGHAQLRVGDSMIELSEGSGAYPPQTCSIHFYVPDVDVSHKRAVAAGGISRAEPDDKPYGERSSDIEDPSGNHWFIAKKI